MSEPRERGSLVSVVAPFHNEERFVDPFVDAIADVASELEVLGCEVEMLLVDDGSDDGTWSRMVARSGEDPAVRSIRLSRNFGKEAALSAGVESASGDAVVTIDGDLQHPPELIPDMVRRWRQGVDVIDGVKTKRAGQSLASRVMSRSFNRVFHFLSGVPIEEASDYKLLDRRAVEAWLALPERSNFFRGTTAWIGFDRVEMPFEVRPRTSGGSRWRPGILFRFAINAITAFSTRPLHLVTMAGFLFAAASVVLLVQTLYRWGTGQAVEGFTTVILLLLVIGAALMIGLGIVGEYIARIHEEVKQRPRYIVRERTGDPPT
jgi:polyisoprenyl-phosphate glycosyltransferase